jgi:MoCo/4Fe-4S cofactor protein with predicted Tat translocation signal
MSQTPTNSTSQGYWRSLNELEQTPEFQAFAKQEFPGFANVYESLGEAEIEEGGLNRRTFMALSAAGLGLAGMAGCRRPDLQILPYSQTPENVSPGLPTFFATSIPRPNGAFPILVESHEGRPTKIEGNPKHPASLGSTDTYAQASVLDLYSPDRSKEVKRKGQISKWEDFDAYLTGLSAALKGTQGKGLAFLSEASTSPSIAKLKEVVAKEFPQSTFHVYEPITSAAVAGSLTAFGKAVTPKYSFEKAKRVLSLDADFCELDGNVITARGYAKSRRAPDDSAFEEHDHKHGKDDKHDHHHDHWEMSRLYIVESTYSSTGTMADHRLRLPVTHVVDYVIALAKHLVAQTGVNVPASVKAAIEKAPVNKLDVPEKWIKEVATDFLAHKGSSLIVAGYKQPALVHAITAFLNETLGNIDKTVEYVAAPKSEKTIQDLVATKDINTLIILGGNPVFNAPAELNFAEFLKAIPNIVRLGYFEDETSAVLARGDSWHLPLSHFLESWGDSESFDGTYNSIQPLIAPLFNTRSVAEFLILLTGYEGATSYSLAKTKVYDLVKQTFVLKSGKSDEISFKRFLHEGFLADSAKKPEKVGVAADSLAEKLNAHKAPATVSDASPEVVLQADYSIYDGRFATNGWLMELPDPITKLVWDNAAYISKGTAEKFGLKNNDVIKVTVGSKSIEIPVFMLPGQANNSITVSLGYGRAAEGSQLRLKNIPTEQVGGVNAYPIRTTTDPYFALAKIEKTGKTYSLVTTQEWGVIPEGRDSIIKEYTTAAYDHLVHGAHEHHEAPKVEAKEGEKKEEAHEGGHGHAHENFKEHFQYGYAVAKAKPAKERIRLDVAYPAKLDGHHQWGMVIDLNACTGCSACVVACQSENNIPIVGKNEVKRNREMHWIRLDRYFSFKDLTDNPDEPLTEGKEKPETKNGLEIAQTQLDDSRIVHQPMMCQQCEAAPCEAVCPVNATVHSPEGLNLQVYNRCIGTRYCSNNCPYKVRRFNWFDFNRRQLDSLRVPTFLGDINEQTQSGNSESISPKGVPETLKMQKNPDVTVRIRGVMEKCTYCIQRIERSKIGSKVLASKANYAKPENPKKAGYDVGTVDGELKVYVPDGNVVTACAQACPSQAIVFGNVNDESSRVYKLKQREADYLVLGEYNTKPRTSYLPRLRNLNPKMVEPKTEKKETT